jgi:hypothetical protein
MAPKKVTNVEKPKRKIIMTSVKFKKRQRQITLDRFFSKKKKI